MIVFVLFFLYVGATTTVDRLKLDELVDFGEGWDYEMSYYQNLLMTRRKESTFDAGIGSKRAEIKEQIMKDQITEGQLKTEERRQAAISIDHGSEADLEELLAIYNYEVEHGVATFDLKPKTLSEWRTWFDAHNVDNHPLLVARVKGKVAGYATLSSYREKEAYRSTVELSVYVGPSHRNIGVATALMAAVLDLAREDERIHTVVSVITSGNEASTKLHEKFGFTFCGTIPEVGMKFGSYRDIDNYRLGV